ncbi:MAG: hypothetical protein NVSMB64_08890 [Candidatus Velthaea sp.]
MTSAPLAIRLFGQPRLTVGDAVYKLLKPRRTLPILAYLLLHRGRAIARDFLAYTISPDEDEESAVAALRRHLYELGKSLPPASRTTPWIIADAETLQWNAAAPYWFDVAEFERASTDRSSLSEAIELYDGDLIETLYDDWVFPHRELLRNTFLSCLSQMVGECRDRRDFAGAVSYTRRLLAADPWREDALRRLMVLQYESGDRAGALHAYETFARSLREEMAVEPMPETIALRETLVRNGFVPGSESRSENVAAPAPRRFSLPFVGRDTEVEQLRQGWHRAARGRGSISLISGEAGIGKSRLVGELSTLAEAEGARVLFGTATFPEPAPYRCLAEALRSGLPLVAAADVQPIWLAALAQIVPEFRVRRADLPPLTILDPNREQQRLFEALSNCVAAVSRQRPLLIVLEDLHWAGASTIDALRFLAWRLVEMPVMLVATFRDEEIVRGHPLRALRRELGANRAHASLSLRGLDRAAVARLAQDVPAIHRHTDDLADWLYARSDGNPFFLAQSIADLLESPGAPHDNAPSGVREMVVARLARLSPEARNTAQVAAVAGSGFSVSLISEVAGMPEYEVLDAVEELLDRHIIRETVGRGQSDYSFGHQLIAAAIYDAMPSGYREQRHRRIARALEDGDSSIADRSVDIAHHYDRSKDSEPAAQHYLVAARNMHERFAGDEALALLHRAFELAAGPPLQFELNVLAAKVHARRGDRRAEQDAVENLERLAEVLDRAEARCGALLARIQLLHALGRPDEEAHAIDAFSQIAGTAGETWRAEALFAQGDLAALTGRLEAEGAIEQAAELYRTAGNARGEIRALCILAGIRTSQGRFREADELLELARRSAITLADAPLIVRALRSANTVATVERDFARSKRIGEEMLALAREVGDREGEADGHSAIAAASGLLFEIDAAEAHYAEAASLFKSLGNRRGEGIVQINAAMLRYAVGEAGKAKVELQAAVKLLEEIGDVRSLTIAILNLSRVLMDVNCPQEARERAEAGALLARQSQSRVLEGHALGLLADASIECGDIGASIGHRRLALELQRDAGPTLAVAGTLADLAWSLSESGDADGAALAAAELRALGEVTPDDILAPSVLWSIARMYRSIGDTAHFRHELERAHLLFVERFEAMPSPSLRSSYANRPENDSIETAYQALSAAFTLSEGRCQDAGSDILE